MTIFISSHIYPLITGEVQGGSTGAVPGAATSRAGAARETRRWGIARVIPGGAKGFGDLGQQQQGMTKQSRGPSPEGRSCQPKAEAQQLPWGKGRWFGCISPLCSQCFCAFCDSGFILSEQPAQRGGDLLRQAGARHRFTAAPAPCSEREKPVPFGTRTGLPKPQAGSRCGSRCWKESCSLKHEGCQSSLAFSPVFFPGVKFFHVPAGALWFGRQW